jgi:hypothetical protein
MAQLNGSNASVTLTDSGFDTTLGVPFFSYTTTTTTTTTNHSAAAASTGRGEGEWGREGRNVSKAVRSEEEDDAAVAARRATQTSHHQVWYEDAASLEQVRGSGPT